jgi:hypothetical protein
MVLNNILVKLTSFIKLGKKLKKILEFIVEKNFVGVFPFPREQLLFLRPWKVRESFRIPTILPWVFKVRFTPIAPNG